MISYYINKFKKKKKEELFSLLRAIIIITIITTAITDPITIRRIILQGCGISNNNSIGNLAGDIEL